MKKIITLIGMMAIIALVPALGGANSLYEQEGTTRDGYVPIIGVYPGTGNANFENWKYQYGGGTWSGIYGHDGWIEESLSGDSTLDIEADIEMYYTEEFSNNKIYFHLGNIYTASAADKTAYVDGTFTSNNGMYIGISFEGTGKDATNLEGDGSGGYTGRVFDAMVGTIDVLNRNIASESFPIVLALSSGSGWTAPVSYGTGASGTIVETLWWLVNGGAAGSYNVKWRVMLEPVTHQPDGNYNFDPAIVAAPML